RSTSPTPSSGSPTRSGRRSRGTSSTRPSGGMRVRNVTSESSGRARLLAHLLRAVTLPHWIGHRLRTVLTAVGVSRGVTTVIGVADISQSVLASFRHMVQTVAGASDLEITASGAGVPEEMVAAAARISGVEATAGLVEAFLALPERPEE